MSPVRRAVIAASVVLAGCQRVPHEAPPRATDRITVPAQSSVIAVPVGADLRELAAALERAVPHRLWAIDKPNQTCVASRQVRILFAKLKTPTLRCRIVGQVTRGTMILTGSGQDITVRLPLHAAVSAQDIGGVLKQETAEAEAHVRARVRLSLARDWSPSGRVDIAYDWTDEPHIDFLGQRIEFTSKADARLKDVVAGLERTLPDQLAKLRFPQRVEQVWRSAFTSLELNQANPPVWMRITPQELDYGGYTIAGNRLTLRLGLKARTETFVGPRPADPTLTPLPPLNRVDRPAGEIVFAIPVIADYRELEPVLARALSRRARRPFDVPGIGPVNARFGKVVVYGSPGGKIAVGLTFSAARPGADPSHGTIWLTARPINAPNSRRVSFADLGVAGVTDSTGASLLIRLANAPGLARTIADALTQNFGKDYDELLAKITRALAERRQGDLLIRARILDVRTGQIKAAGQGIYLPVSGRGTASIMLDHRKGPTGT